MKEETVENLLPLVYLTTFVGTTFFLFRANYILFMRMVFVPLALGVATVLSILEKTYPSYANILTMGLASGALLFMLVNVYIVINKLLNNPDRKAIAQKIAFNKDYE